MEDMFSYRRRDFCFNCNTVGTIELYDIFNKPINYSLLVTRYLQGEDIDRALDHRELSYFRCTKCGREFRIDWRKDHFPIPFVI